MSVKPTSFQKSIKIKGSTTATTEEGEIRNDSANQKIKAHIEGAEREVVTENQTQTLENKTIDGTAATGNNSVSADSANITYDDANNPVSSIGTDVQAALDGVKTALDNQNDASEINYDPSSNPETVSTNIQGALDDTGIASQAAQDAADAAQTTADNHISDAADAHTASAITNVPSGNLAATDVQGAVDELQTDIDTRALDSDLTAHINDATDAHAASAITNTPSGNVSATTVQGAVDELQTDIDTRATDADLTAHTGATSGVHGVTGNVVGDTDTQTLTNKTVSGGTVENASVETPTRLDAKQDTLANLQTYAATATNGQYVFATDVKKSFQIIDNNLVPIGSGGGFNYFGDDENGAENGIGTWTVYANTTPANKPDDFGGTPNGSFTFTQNTSNPLIGDADFQLNKPAANVQGNGVYYEFTAENGHQTLKHLFSCLLDGSDILDDDISIWLVGSDDSFAADFTYISANNPDVIVSAQIFKQFQFVNKSAYRICIHYNATDTDAKTVNFDDFQLGPKEAVIGAVVTDSIQYTPTFTSFGTVTNDEIYYARVGDRMRIQGTFQHGTLVTSEARISLPDNLSISSDITTVTNVGSYVRGADSALNGGLVLANGGNGYLNLSSVLVYSGTSTDPLVIANGNDVSGGSGTVIAFECEVPIEGWSAQTTSSSDLGGRDIIIDGAGNGGTALTANVTDIDFTEIKDTSASWNGSSFTAPESGKFSFTGMVLFSTGVTSTVSSFLNGVVYRNVSQVVTQNQNSFSFTIELEKGDVVSVRNNSNRTLVNDTAGHWINIVKLASPQTILETETVAARYTSDSGQTVASGGNSYLYEDKDFDTHNAYNPVTGEYTTPISGFYQINASVRSSVNVTLLQLSIVVNDTTKKNQLERANTATTISCDITDLIYVNKGDIVEIQNTQGVSQTLSTLDFENTFSITRVK